MLMQTATVQMPPKSILLGMAGDQEMRLLLNRANRHGGITGATGTGKTVTLKTLALRLSEAGVPVFLPDIKGDLGDLAAAAPVRHWDLAGEHGTPIRVSIRDIGATIFSRILSLNEVQKSVVTVMFEVAKREGFALDDFQDVRVVLAYLLDNAKDITARYGLVASQTVGAIQRTMLELESVQADQFFGPTTFSLDEIMQRKGGRGVISILRAETLIHNPVVYSSFLMWLLNELFMRFPEVGDPEQPELVFFFDEAHVLFEDAPKPFLQMIERVVRLIRSKGVGVYFVSQSPADLPDAILAQLGNRIQHRLAAYTPRDRQGLKAAADSFRPNPSLGSTIDAIQGLGVGEALVSLLDQHGIPGVVERTKIAAVQLPRISAAPLALPRPILALPSPTVVAALDNEKPEPMAPAVVELIETPQWAVRRRKPNAILRAAYLFPLFAITASLTWGLAGLLPM